MKKREWVSAAAVVAAAAVLGPGTCVALALGAVAFVLFAGVFLWLALRPAPITQHEPTRDRRDPNIALLSKCKTRQHPCIAESTVCRCCTAVAMATPLLHCSCHWRSHTPLHTTTTQFRGALLAPSGKCAHTRHAMYLNLHTVVAAHTCTRAMRARM